MASVKAATLIVSTFDSRVKLRTVLDKTTVKFLPTQMSNDANPVHTPTAIIPNVVVAPSCLNV